MVYRLGAIKEANSVLSFIEKLPPDSVSTLPFFPSLKVVDSSLLGFIS